MTPILVNTVLRRNKAAALMSGGGGASTYVGPISNNTLLPTTLITSGRATQLTVHQSNNGLSDIRIGLARAYFTGNYLKLTPLPASYTVNEISVRLVSGGPVTTIATNRTVTPWNGTDADTAVDWVDLTSVPAIAAGAPFYIFIATTGGNLPAISSAGCSIIYTDEFLRTTVGAPTTFTTSITQTDANRRTRLGAIVGIEGTRSGKSVAIIGDSLTANISGALAVSDGLFADHNRGIVPNMIGGAYDYVNLGVGGDQWETRLYDSKMQNELTANASVIVFALGINSFNNKSNTSEVTPLGLFSRALPRYNGKQVLLAQITPRTSGAWTLADGSDQTVATYSAALDAYNTSIAAISETSLLAVRAPVALAANQQKIYADGTTNFSTPDGLHYKLAALLRASASYGASARALVGSAAVMSGKTQPAATLSGAGTYAGGTLTNGTMTRNDILPGQAVFTLIMKITLGASLASAHAFLPNLGTGWLKTVQVNTAGTLTVTNAASASITTTAALNFNAENEVMFALDGTNIYVFINGVFDSSIANGGNSAVAPNFQFAALSSKNVSIREVTIWNYARQTSGSYTPEIFTGAEAGCVVRWPLATDATAIIGPVLPS